MEEILRRFQHIGKQIFKELDNKSLAKCRKADRSWRTFIDDQKFSWIRKIRFCSIDSKEPLEKILKQTKLDIVKELAEKALSLCFCKFKNKMGFDLNRRKTGHILYFAAMIGYEDVFKEESISKFNEKNPDTLFRQTPLHFAAEEGHLSICQLIIQNLKADNPDSAAILNYGEGELGSDNPLLLAFYEDHFDICKLIIENLEYKNPVFNARDEYGTALHEFAQMGQLDICEIIIKDIGKGKHPTNYMDRTPFHDAALNGHLSICQLIIEHFDDKNPRDAEWLTPLHIAAENGNLAICKLIIDNFKDTYPKGLWGISPYHESPYEKARASGHSNICKLFDENIDFKIRRDKRGPNFWLGPDWWM
jgi:ankyrin repeat protein